MIGMRKRLFASVLTAAVSAVTVLCSFPASHAQALQFTPSCTVQSDSAILLNLDVGDVVYEKNADMKEAPAALSQIMTAVIVLENCSDPSKVTITASEEMYSLFKNEENQTDLRYADIDAGDTLTAEDLLYAMMLTSSCEADYMLSEHFGGTVEGFVSMMNAKAEELGMESTRFTTVGQLYSPRQLTTARDMMKLLEYAMTVPRFETIACASRYTPPSAAELDRTEDWSWTHSNLMTDESSEYYVNGARGIKTANSQDGGRSIALKSSQDGVNYLLICMNSPLEDLEGNKHFYHIEDATNILEWAYLHLSFQEIMTDSTELGEIKVVNAKDDDGYVIVRPLESFSCIWCDTMELSSVQKVGNWPTKIEAPVYVGTELGTVTLKLSGDTLAEIKVVAQNTVERSFWKYNLSEIPGFFTSKYLKMTFVLAVIFSVIYIILCIYFAFKYHEGRKKRAAARAGYYKKKK